MNKKKVIIGLIFIIIIAAIAFIILTAVNYERIEITPNGTTLDVPAEQTKYRGSIGSIKIWNWKNGILVTFNSQEKRDILNASAISYNALNDIIKNGEMQNIEGYTCYVINANELLKIKIFEIINLNNNAQLYCIPLSNETSHDNLLICCNDRNIALHMAQSVEYKNVYPNITDSGSTLSKIENITENLKSQENINNVKSSIENKTADFLSKIPV